MQYTINTIDELYEFIGREDIGSITSLKFGDDIARLNIKYKGDNYHSSLTANAMQGLIELQRSLYKAGAYALYTVDSAAHLTQNDKEMLLLTFEINEGCTELFAKIDKLLEKIGEGFKTMDSKHKLIAIAIVAALIVGGWVADSIVESGNIATQENTKIKLEQEKTRQMELMLQKHSSLNKIKENIDAGFRHVIQGASDADEISIAKVVFDKDVITSLSERAKRKPTNSMLIDSSFSINSINTSSAELLKFALSNQDGGVEFQASLESGEFNADEKALLWNAAINRQAINLKVNVAMSGDTIKHGSIVYIGDLKEST